jgi:hypothetical protein
LCPEATREPNLVRHIDATTPGQNPTCIRVKGSTVMTKLVTSAPSRRPKTKRRTR